MAEKKRARPQGAQEYKGNGNHAWEPVAEDLRRIRVPGGWLYGIYSPVLHRVVSVSFVKTPEVVGYAI